MRPGLACSSWPWSTSFSVPEFLAACLTHSLSFFMVSAVLIGSLSVVWFIWTVGIARWPESQRFSFTPMFALHWKMPKLPYCLSKCGNWGSQDRFHVPTLSYFAFILPSCFSDCDSSHPPISTSFLFAEYLGSRCAMRLMGPCCVCSLYSTSVLTSCLSLLVAITQLSWLAKALCTLSGFDQTIWPSRRTSSRRVIPESVPRS